LRWTVITVVLPLRLSDADKLERYSREEDWITDTLALREELEASNEVFTDPIVIKVR
jgi:hypothetical protein